MTPCWQARARRRFGRWCASSAVIRSFTSLPRRPARKGQLFRLAHPSRSAPGLHQADRPISKGSGRWQGGQPDPRSRISKRLVGQAHQTCRSEVLRAPEREWSVLRSAPGITGGALYVRRRRRLPRYRNASLRGVKFVRFGNTLVRASSPTPNHDAKVAPYWSSEMDGSHTPRPVTSSGPCNASVGKLPYTSADLTAALITMWWLPHA